MKKLILIGALFLTSFNFKATYYANVFEGRRTFNGEVYTHSKMTCASNYYPIGSKLKITNVKNGKSVIVKVNDKGGMSDYIIDLSKGAFKKIASLKSGIIEINVIRL
jgi:rare lipoprotein A